MFYLLSWNELAAQYRPWSLYALATLVTLRVFAFLAIRFWSKTGVVAYVSLTAIAVTVLGAVGQRMGVIGIIGVAILIALVRPKWRHMTWGISGHPRCLNDSRDSSDLLPCWVVGQLNR